MARSPSLHPHWLLLGSGLIIFLLVYEWLNLSEALAIFLYFVLILRLPYSTDGSKSQPGSADALGLVGHRDAFLSCVYQCLQNCKELCMIHILIQLGISVRYLCATDFINSLSDNCFTLNVGSCFFKGLGSAFPKHLLWPFRFS